VNISQLPILHPELMEVRILFFCAKVNHAHDRSDISVDEVVPVDYFDSARFGHPNGTRRIRIVVAIGIHPTFNAGTWGAPWHFGEVGIIPKCVVIGIGSIERVLAVSALFSRKDVPFLLRRILLVLCRIKKPVVFVCDKTFNFRD
jgi:hypothetical protein